MALYDLSETDKMLENLFGRRAYKWLNRVIRIIAIIGILLCVIAYFLDMDGIFNITTVGYTLILLIVGAIIIAGIIRCVSWLISK